jgi:BirA family transcriptional regulator, biotin operon repressor / biotin---[acetyl-CoA-carboxylase] ligase
VSGGVVVVGLGLNLFWSQPPAGVGSLYEEAPAEGRYKEIGALWVAELMALIDGVGWPVDEYRSACVTLGKEISWDPDGAGRAIDVDDDGSLIVETDAGTESIHAGAVRHIR